MKKIFGYLKCCVCDQNDARNDDGNEREYGPFRPLSNGEDFSVKDIDPCVFFNGVSHRTSKYDLMRTIEEPQLVIRRGQPFKLHIALSKRYEKEKDHMTFIFSAEDMRPPSYGRGTLVAVPLTTEQASPYHWSAVIESINEDIVTVLITPSSDCIVGKWRMSIDTKTKSISTFKWDINLYILFNPWCEEDQVYMESEEWREEAVMNDDGMIWRGSAKNFGPSLWKYSQFEKDILECSLYLLNNVGKVTGEFRSDPVIVTRALSAAINVQDDGGVVVGNWSGKYSGGAAPSDWTGSFDILKKYYEKKKPVKYGQCWVFAGVLTSVCKSLGIPSRVVTNFQSAHDSDGSITIDHFVDESGKIVEEYSDSVWNFHVWTEVWMSRPDLGKEYDGWQVIDATPQEKSTNIYRCGPASVAACKLGEIRRPYDITFVFAEVNADMVYWYVDSTDQTLKLLAKKTNEVGQFISTKSPGSFSRLDITENYKYPEYSENERIVHLKAMRQVDHIHSRYYINESFEDVIFQLELRDDVLVGQPFDVGLSMKNKSSSKKHVVNATLRVDAVTYTNKPISTIKTQAFITTVDANSSEKLTMNIQFGDYSKYLVQNCMFNVSCIASVESTNFHYYDRDIFKFQVPKVDIKLSGKLVEGAQLVAEVVVKNPLPVPLKDGEFYICAPGSSKRNKFKIKDKIMPDHEAIQKFSFVTNELGKHTIGVKFVSKQLNDVDGFHHFVIEQDF